MEKLVEIESSFEKGTFRWFLCTWFEFPENWQTKLQTACPSGRAQEEVCPETGKHHIQFVLYFKERVSAHAIHIVVPGAWVVGCPDADKNKILNYVKKTETAVEGTRIEWGSVKGYWQQTTSKHAVYLQALDLCKANKWKEIDPELQVKHLPNLVKLTALYVKPLESQTCRGLWIYGLPGAGKSHYARHYDSGPIYIKPQNKWWDGYTGESTVILEDFDSSALSHLLKIWADKWSASGEVKGATVPLAYRTFIVTSNYLPRSPQLWGSQGDSSLVAAIERRFRFITITDQAISYEGDFGRAPEQVALGTNPERQPWIYRTRLGAPL